MDGVDRITCEPSNSISKNPSCTDQRSPEWHHRALYKKSSIYLELWVRSSSCPSSIESLSLHLFQLRSAARFQTRNGSIFPLVPRRDVRSSRAPVERATHEYYQATNHGSYRPEPRRLARGLTRKQPTSLARADPQKCRDRNRRLRNQPVWLAKPLSSYPPCSEPASEGEVSHRCPHQTDAQNFLSPRLPVQRAGFDRLFAATRYSLSP